MPTLKEKGIDAEFTIWRGDSVLSRVRRGQTVLGRKIEIMWIRKNGEGAEKTIKANTEIADFAAFLRNRKTDSGDAGVDGMAK